MHNMSRRAMLQATCSGCPGNGLLLCIDDGYLEQSIRRFGSVAFAGQVRVAGGAFALGYLREGQMSSVRYHRDRQDRVAENVEMMGCFEAAFYRRAGGSPPFPGKAWVLGAKIVRLEIGK